MQPKAKLTGNPSGLFAQLVLSYGVQLVLLSGLLTRLGLITSVWLGLKVTNIDVAHALFTGL